MTRKKSNLKPNRRKISRLDRKQNTVYRTIKNHKVSCNSKKFNVRSQAQTLKEKYSKRKMFPIFLTKQKRPR